MLHRSLIIAGAAGLSMFMIPSAQAQLIYDFDSPAGDDGLETDGWVHTTPPGGVSSPVSGGRGADRTAGEDGPHQNMVFSSPEFFLDGSGDLTFQLHGGWGNGEFEATTFYSNLSDIPNAMSTDVDDDAGRQYVALRRVSDGAYLINRQRSSAANSWETQTITAAELSALNQSVAYQLDLIETGHGSWGHTEIDDVSIPGTLVPEPGALSLLGAAGLLALRRRR